MGTMKLLVALLALAISAVAGAENNDTEPIITNGNPAYDGQAPYVVGMAFQLSNIWCSGTIIGDTWILTASACLSGSAGVTIYFGATRRSEPQFTIIVGSSSYVVGGGKLALVRIPRIGFSNLVNRVLLPSLKDRSQRYENVWTSICGWGVTSYTNIQPDWLQCVDLQVISNSECISFFGSPTVTEETLCTRSQNGKSTCYGDAGSPLVTKIGSIMVGLSLFVSSNGCTLGFPAGYVRITSQLDWIRQSTGISY